MQYLRAVIRIVALPGALAIEIVSFPFRVFLAMALWGIQTFRDKAPWEERILGVLALVAVGIVIPIFGWVIISEIDDSPHKDVGIEWMERTSVLRLYFVGMRKSYRREVI